MAYWRVLQVFVQLLFVLAPTSDALASPTIVEGGFLAAALRRAEEAAVTADEEIEETDAVLADAAQTHDDDVVFYAAIAEKTLQRHHTDQKIAGSSSSRRRGSRDADQLRDEVGTDTHPTEQRALLCSFKQYAKDAAILGVRQRSMIQLIGSELPKVNGTCAVVGSGGTLLRKKHGKDIDKAAKVFRFNLAPVKHFQKYVGSRTDLRFVNEKVLDMWNKEKQLSMLGKSMAVASCTRCGLGTDDRAVGADEFNRRSLDVILSHPQARVFASDLTLERATLDFLNLMYNFSAGKAGATTGAFGMAVAMSICDEVKAYGMAASPYDEKLPYHYWQSDSKSQPHEKLHSSFNAEKELWLRLATSSPDEVSESGVAVIPGFATINCSGDS